MPPETHTNNIQYICTNTLVQKNVTQISFLRTLRIWGVEYLLQISI